MRSFLAAMLIASPFVLVFPPSSHAATIEGTWSGSGYVNPKDGPREKVRCRITYSKQSQKVFGVHATCATTSTKILQTGEVLMVNPNRYVGDFYNSQYDVSGRVRVRVSGGRQTVSFSSARGHGSITLHKK